LKEPKKKVRTLSEKIFFLRLKKMYKNVKWRFSERPWHCCEQRRRLIFVILTLRNHPFGNLSGLILDIKAGILKNHFQCWQYESSFFRVNAFISLFSTHKHGILSQQRIQNSIAVFSPKTLYPGVIRTRVVCSWGGCDVQCTTPLFKIPFLSTYVYIHTCYPIYTYECR
jgi:hypothetical protein